VINSHGAPHHLRALDLAGDYFHDTYGGDMVHLTGVFGLDQLDNIARSLMTQAERDEDGLGIQPTLLKQVRLCTFVLTSSIRRTNKLRR
jgi:hypothetical protein